MDITRMGKTPEKTEKPKKMTDKEQSARFIQTARELDTDESSKHFTEAFSKIVPSKIGKKLPT